MTQSRDATFQLDPRLAADTRFIDDWKLCRLLLMDDARFPWLVLVPRRSGLVESDDLGARESVALLREIHRAMRVLRAVVECEKLNVAALGNIVRQLHVHVVARRSDDAAWPGPVWGHGRAVPHTPEARERLIAALRVAATSSSAPEPPRRSRG